MEKNLTIDNSCNGQGCHATVLPNDLELEIEKQIKEFIPSE